MKFNFTNKKISGILTVIPKNELSFDDEVNNYPSTPKQMRNLKKVMGFDKRRITDKGVGVADLGTFGIEKILSAGYLQKDEIGALILVTQTPDYLMPPTTNIIQGRLNLSSDVYCLDMNNGCAGYVVGLIQAFQLLEHMQDKKVLFITAEISALRQNMYKGKPSTNRDSLLWGDALSITVLENDFADSAQIVAEVVIDGKRWDTIVYPTKTFHELNHSEDAEIANAIKSYSDMNGGEVFKFTQVDVPPIIKRVLADSGKTKDDIDWFLLHQPNKLMVEKVAEELELDFNKTFMNTFSKFGNSSCATIPTSICYNLPPDILKKTFSVCISGFGTGLTCSVMTMKLGPLKFCEIAEY